MLADLWQDLRYGARMLLKRPVFTSTAVLTLGFWKAYKYWAN